MRPWLVIVVGTFIAPHVSASGTLESSFFVVTVDNGKPDDCLDQFTGLCLVDGRVDGVGATEINTTQSIRRLGVATNDSQLEELTQLELLPDGSFTVDMDTLTLPNPVSRELTTRVGSLRGPGALHAFSLTFSERGIRMTWWGPPAELPPDPAPSERSFVLTYSEEGVGHDRIGPFSELTAMTSTDEYVEDGVWFACRRANTSGCDEALDTVSSHLLASTPNVALGAQVFVATAATSPALLHEDALLDDRRAGSEPLGRGTSHLAPVRLTPLQPSAALPLASQGPSTIPSFGPLSPAPSSSTAMPRIAGEDPEPKVPSAIPILVAGAAAFLLAVAAAALYSRVTRREEALLNERRLAILSLLGQHGPLSFGEIGRRLGVDRTTVEHHTRLLRRTEHIKMQRVGRQLYVALPRQRLPEESLGAGDAAEAIVEILRQRGGALPRADLHEAASKFPLRSRNEALRRLATGGRIERAFAGPVEIIRLPAQRG